jgi:hypothetical protein
MSWQQNIENLSTLTKKIDELLPIMQQIARPPDQTILDDVGLRDMLKMSKRSTAYLREKGLITYSKIGSKIYYRLSDILSFLKQNEIPAINAEQKLFR